MENKELNGKNISNKILNSVNGQTRTFLQNFQQTLYHKSKYFTELSTFPLILNVTTLFMTLSRVLYPSSNLTFRPANKL